MKQEIRYDSIWHPFTPQLPLSVPLNIVSSKGSLYFDDKGNQYIDAISSWWVNLHGHSHPHIAEQISKQASANAHSIFSGFTHPQAQRLASRILALLPGNQQKVFFSDDGSTAVEVAVKMALQYFHNRGEKKNRIIALDKAYHGDTFGSMSVGARNIFSAAYESHLFSVEFLPTPSLKNRDQCLNALRNFIAKDDIAAFIFEPLVQGAGGMVMHDSVVLSELIEICQKSGIICIADEVMTGFGRIGTLFASEQLSQHPDIFCLSKGLTGGFLPLGITTCKKFIHEAYETSDRTKTFFHGHSYTGNPIACAAANASLDLFGIENTMLKIKWIEAQHKGFLRRMKERFTDWEIRQCGTILAFEYLQEESEYLSHAGARASEFLFQHNIIVRPLGNVFYLLPPYCITNDELTYIYSVIEKFYAGHP
jgi:adenosylmethionine---8-amino-7-oxononanoate aminotransferase